MTEQDWHESGFTEASLGPGEDGWIRRLTNGSYILATKLDSLPEGFQIGLYTPQGEEFGPSVYLEIGRAFSLENIPDEIPMKQLLVSMFNSFESILSVLPAKTPA